jgi:hypothetical protein
LSLTTLATPAAVAMTAAVASRGSFAVAVRFDAFQGKTLTL